jgi:hypothetical protein
MAWAGVLALSGRYQFSELKQFPSVLCRHGSSASLEEHWVEQSTVLSTAQEENSRPQHKQDLAHTAAIWGQCFARDLPTHNLDS